MDSINKVLEEESMIRNSNYGNSRSLLEGYINGALCDQNHKECNSGRRVTCNITKNNNARRDGNGFASDELCQEDEDKPPPDLQ